MTTKRAWWLRQLNLLWLVAALVAGYLAAVGLLAAVSWLFSPGPLYEVKAYSGDQLLGLWHTHSVSIGTQNGEVSFQDREGVAYRIQGGTVVVTQLKVGSPHSQPPPPTEALPLPVGPAAPIVPVPATIEITTLYPE